MILVAVALFMSVAASCAVATEVGEPDAPRLPGLREKIGQMIVVGFLGNDTGDQWFGEVLTQIRQGKLGGVLYLGRNITDRKAVVGMNAAILDAAGDRPPTLIAIDQEGGIVQRLTGRVGFPEIPSARRIATRIDPQAARETYAELARHLREWGFNLNLGPVVDVNVNPANPIIGRLGRAYGADPAVVARYAKAFVQGHREHAVLTAIKHFPGHGSSRGDSHKGLVDVTRSWNRSELKPYETRIRAGSVDFVMTGHIRNANSQWLNGRALGSDLEARLDRPVRLANDADCFALSEARDGAAAGAGIVFGVILGTGTGGGIVIDGKLLDGAQRIAGEWGHNPLPWPQPDEYPGPQCWCGQTGCLETWLSGPGIAQDHARRTGITLTALEIARSPDPACQDSMARHADRLARALASVVNLIDPHMIVLGGGVSNVDGLAETVQERLSAHIFSDVRETRVVRHRHGDSSGVRGAAWLWPAEPR